LRRVCAFAALLPALAACAPLAPPAAGPRPGIPAAFPGASGSDAAPVAAATAWQDFFTEPELRALISGALEHNRDLRAAVLRTEEARAAWGIQRAQRAPGLALALDGARSRMPGDLSPTGQPVVGDQFQLGVGFTSWELDFWGRIRSLEDAAIEGYLATDAARRAATIGLVAQVAQAWLALRETERRLLLAQRALDSRAESLRIHRRRFELGASSRLELTQVELLSSGGQPALAARAGARSAGECAAPAGRQRTRPPQATPDGALAHLPELPADLPSSRCSSAPTWSRPSTGCVPRARTRRGAGGRPRGSRDCHRRHRQRCSAACSRAAGRGPSRPR
jgi:multidrug efflux system outer membrane protein